MFFIVESVRVKFFWLGPKLRRVTTDISAHLKLTRVPSQSTEVKNTTRAVPDVIPRQRHLFHISNCQNALLLSPKVR